MLKDRCVQVAVLSIVLVFLAGLLKPQSPDPRRQVKTERDRYWTLKTHRPTQVDMIILGNSRAYRGISPGAMKRYLPDQRILNFGYSGGGLNPLIYREAEKRFDSSQAFKSIVLAVSPGTLSPRAARNTFFLQEQARRREEIYQRLYINPLLDFLEPVAAEELVNAISGKQRDYKKKKYYQEFYDDGWVASWTVPEDHERLLNRYREEGHSVDRKVSEEILHRLLEQTADWTRRGIDVYGFRPPSSPAMEAIENELSGFDEDTFVKQFQAVGGIWFSFPSEKYHSYDGSHLHKDSAVQLSRDLSKAIAGHQKAFRR